MQLYQAPLRDMRFVVGELFDVAELDELGLSGADGDLVDAILGEAARFCQDVLLPLNASGDREGCRYENGTVATPAGFRDAYRRFREGGWASLSAAPAHGGQGVPESVAKLVEEMICASNPAFGLYTGLTRGACVALDGFASDEIKARFMPALVAGEWSGTMCLTEAHCGTDLGLMRTRAVPVGNGSFAVTGSKIFISSGEHDLADNIVHLVLARLPDAPPGIKGISLFVVPRGLPTDGPVGARNGVICTGIEQKMGMKGSATCQITFEAARGWLVGAPHKGMQAMFAMMNSERLAVGNQGLGIGEAAYQNAAVYARSRLQGRAATGPRHPGQPADPIIVHADVRKMLMRMRAETEGCRALGAWVARALDRSRRARDPAARAEAADFCALMTPVVKALFTDLGFENASRGMQVHGGHGFIRDQGVEQYVRDARIAMIYEGTNGIQALDFVGRKVPAHNGRLLRTFTEPVAAFIAAHRDEPAVAPLVAGLAAAVVRLDTATACVLSHHSLPDGSRERDGDAIGTAATDYLRLFGLVALAFMWARAALVAERRLAGARDEADRAFYAAKRVTARFFFDRILPETAGLVLAVTAGKASTMMLDDAAF